MMILLVVLLALAVSLALVQLHVRSEERAILAQLGYVAPAPLPLPVAKALKV